MPLFDLPEPTRTDVVVRQVNDVFGDTASYLQRQLLGLIKILSDPSDAALFWTYCGKDGMAILSKFAEAVSLLNSLAPELITEEIAAAGSTLKQNDDGTVTLPE